MVHVGPDGLCFERNRMGGAVCMKGIESTNFERVIEFFLYQIENYLANVFDRMSTRPYASR